MGECACTCGQGRRTRTAFQPGPFSHAKPGETFSVDQHWAASVRVSSLVAVSPTSLSPHAKTARVCRRGAEPGLLVLPSLTQVCVFHHQVFKQPWPGIMRTLYGNHQQFETTYFKKFPGYYVTGDGKVVQAVCGCRGLGDSNVNLAVSWPQNPLSVAPRAGAASSRCHFWLFLGCRRDKDGYYWITGRIDDMLNVSGKKEFCLRWGGVCFRALAERGTLLYGGWFCARDSAQQPLLRVDLIAGSGLFPRQTSLSLGDFLRRFLWR